VAGFHLENWPSEAHSQAMELINSKIIGFLVAVCTAAVAALTIGYVAHYDFGLSRLGIRTSALVSAVVVATLLATEYFEKNLRKPK
jgi:energy-converting hydrogenase Eha subunit H